LKQALAGAVPVLGSGRLSEQAPVPLLAAVLR
jgi:hypothetical protein